MRAFTRFLVAASVAVLSPALAMEPPASTTQAAQPSPEPADSESAAPASTQSASTTSTADTKTAPPSDQAPRLVLTAGDADAASQLKRLRAAGYKPESHGSEIWFCRKETVIGSRLEKKICNTADQLIRQEQDAREATDHIQRRISGDPIDPSIIGKVGGLCCGHRP